MKRFLLAVLILLALPSLATAQTNTTADVDTIGQTQCTAVLNTNMRYRMRDSQTNNEVSALQDFLNVEGYLASQPTGFFGLATLNAVKKFQSASGFVPTGYVGPLTRAKINAMSCGTGVTATPTQYASVPTPQVSTRPIASTQSSLPAGCSSTVGFSSTTGNRCNTPATPTLSPAVQIFPAGCTSSIGYSSTTGQKCSVVTAVVPEVPVVANDIATADLKVNGSNGPLTLSLNQQVFLSWKTTGMRSCTLGNVNETPSNGTDTIISPIPLSGSMYAYYTGYNPAIMLSCFKTTDGSISSGGDIVKLTYAPVPVVATSTQNTTAYAITSTSVIPTTYAGNAPISLSIKTIGGEGDGTPATSDKGYNIQAYIYNASDTGFSNYLAPNPTYSYNGTYNVSTGYWSVQMNVPSTPGSYNLRVALYCSRYGTTCYNAGGHGTESVKIIPFTVQGAVTTAVPTVEFVGTPTLSIQYEKGSGNELLEGRATVRITAGNSPITIYQNSVSGTLPFNNSSGTTYSNGMKFSTTASNGTVITGNIGIPANTSQTFTVVNTAPTKELFAGSYLVKPAGFQYIDSSNSYQTVQYTSFINARSSNSLTIVGETSPYLNKVYSDPSSTTNGYVIEGVRFHPTSNQVIVNGVSKTLPSESTYSSTSGNVMYNTLIRINPSDFGINSTGGYLVYVIHPTEGASNRLTASIQSSSIVATTAAITSPLTVTANTPFTISGTASPSGSVIEFLFGNNGGSGSALVLSNGTWSMYWGGSGLSAGSYPITISSRSSSGTTGAVLTTGTLVVTSSIPTVEFIGTPTLGLQYDSAGKESMLVGRATIKISAGGSPINIGYSAQNAHVARMVAFNDKNGQVYANSLIYSAVGSPECVPTATAGCLIPANNSITFNVENRAKTSELFGGTYSLKPAYFTYLDANNNNQTIQPQDIKGNSASNSVTIVGETSPYIMTASQPMASGAYLSKIDILGFRFHPTTNYITVNGISKTLPSGASDTGNYTVIMFNLSDFNIVSPGIYPVQVTHPTTGASNIVTMTVFAIPATVAPAPVLMPAIKLLSPNGGETIASNSQYTVQWNTSNYAPSTLINMALFTSTVTPPTEASYSAGFVSTLAVSTPNDGSEVVSIPSGLSGTTYFIRVMGRDMTPTGTAFPNGCLSGCRSDDSDAPFTITAPSTQSASVIGAFATIPTQQAPAVVPTPTFEYAWDRNLEVNSPYADDVSALQTALTKEGVYNGEVTGGFYTQTYLAVKAFQSKYGIEATGFVGQTTRAKLNDLY